MAGRWLNFMIPEVLFNLNDSVILSALLAAHGKERVNTVYLQLYYCTLNHTEL